VLETAAIITRAVRSFIFFLLSQWSVVAINCGSWPWKSSISLGFG